MRLVELKGKRTKRLQLTIRAFHFSSVGAILTIKKDYFDFTIFPTSFEISDLKRRSFTNYKRIGPFVLRLSHVVQLC